MTDLGSRKEKTVPCSFSTCQNVTIFPIGGAPQIMCGDYNTGVRDWKDFDGELYSSPGNQTCMYDNSNIEISLNSNSWEECTQKKEVEVCGETLTKVIDKLNIFPVKGLGNWYRMRIVEEELLHSQVLSSPQNAREKPRLSGSIILKELLHL